MLVLATLKEVDKHDKMRMCLWEERSNVMDTYTYEKIVKDVESGVEHMVLNIERNVVGKVDMCRHGYFNVKVEGGEEVWPMAKCKEIDVEKTKNTGRLSTF